MDRVKKFEEIKGPRAFEAFADLIPAVLDLTHDSAAVDFFSGNGPKTALERATTLLGVATRNRDTFTAIEAIKRGAPADDMSMDDIMGACFELLKDPIFRSFFVLAHRDTAPKTSITAPDPTTAPAE